MYMCYSRTTGTMQNWSSVRAFRCQRTSPDEHMYRCIWPCLRSVLAMCAPACAYSRSFVSLGLFMVHQRRRVLEVPAHKRITALHFMNMLGSAG